MQFVRVDSLLDAAAPLHNCLMGHMEDGKQVLWVLSGGSAIELEVAVMRQLNGAQTSDLSSNLTVMLMDERYGAVGHTDSNDQKLAVAGFKPQTAKWIKVLQKGLNMDETCKSFAANAEEAFAKADVIIGLFGMGANGHIAGIQPESPAVSSADFAVSFDWSDFQRITLTPKALAGVTTAFLVALGQDKRQQLERLRDKDLPISEQPAQLLKQLPEAYVYNDQIADNTKEREV